MKTDLYLCQVFPHHRGPRNSFPHAPIGDGLQVGREPTATSSLCLDEETVSRVHFHLQPHFKGMMEMLNKDSARIRELVTTPEFVESLLLHSWPRNARQLYKVVSAAVRHVKSSGQEMPAFSKQGQLPNYHIPAPNNKPQDLETTRPRKHKKIPPREELVRKQQEVNNNVSALARHYKCDRKQIYRWLDRYQLR